MLQLQIFTIVRYCQIRLRLLEQRPIVCPPFSWPRRSHLYFSENSPDRDYLLSLVDDACPGEYFSFGIDDRNGNENWTTSLKQNYPQLSALIVDGDSGSISYGYIMSMPCGFITSGDCILTKYFICKTQQLNINRLTNLNINGSTNFAPFSSDQNIIFSTKSSKYKVFDSQGLGNSRLSLMHRKCPD